MTVPQNPNTRTEAVGNGVTLIFAFDFLCLEARDIQVSVSDVLLAPSQYTVTGLGQLQGGTVSFVSAPANGAPILMELAVVAARAIDYQDNGDLFAQTVNFDFDRLWLAIKSAFGWMRRALVLGTYDVDGAGSYRANNNRIQDLADPVAEQDAVNQRSMFSFVTEYVDKAIAGVVGGFGWFLQAGIGAIYRTFQDKMRDAVSVRDFGQVGDGVADDTAVFALALASSAKRVYVPEGVHILEGLSIPAGKTLFGPGTLKWKDAAGSQMITLAGARATLEDLTFDGNGAAQTGDRIMVVAASAPYAAIRKCTITNGRYKFFRSEVGNSPHVQIRDCHVFDWGSAAGCNVFDFRSSYSSCVGNHFENIGDGHCVRIGVYESDAPTPVIGCAVSGNVFHDTEHVGVCLELYAQYASITGNTFDTLEQGIKAEGEGGTSFNHTITGNSFKGLYQATSANNLSGTRIVFSNNVLQDCGSTSLGPGNICSGNIFQRCGNLAASQPSVRVISTATNCTITDNYVDNSPYDGITIGAVGGVCKNNKVNNAFRRGIDLSADSVAAMGNQVIGGQLGLVVSSGATNAYVTGNKCTGASTNNFSVVNTQGLYIDQTNVGYSGNTSSLAISGGVLSLLVSSTVMNVAVDTEGAAAADDLDTITPVNPCTGQLIVLRSNSASRPVTVKDATGNMQLAGDFVLTNTRDRLTLVWNGTAWDEVSRSDNA